MPSPSVLQSQSGNALAASTITVTFASPVTAGNMIVVFPMVDSSFNTINTPTMTGETFVQRFDIVGAVNGSELKCYTQNSAAGGQTQVTFTTANPGSLHLHIAEITGQSATPIDQTGTSENTTQTVSTSGSTTTTTDLNIACFWDVAAALAWSVGSGYTQLEQILANFEGSFSEWQQVSSTGVQSASAGGQLGNSTIQGILSIAGTSAALIISDDTMPQLIIQLPDTVVSRWG